MNIDIKPIRCFVCVADELSFSKAAKKLHITQPTLSAQIKALEEKAGFSLFTRTTRSVELSKDGQALLKDAKDLVRQSDQFGKRLRKLNGIKDRRLRLGAALYTLDIPERNLVIDQFISAYPEYDVTVDTNWQTRLQESLVQGDLDAAFVISIAVPHHVYQAAKDRNDPTECIRPDSLPSLVLRSEPIQLLVPRESELAKHDVVPVSALSGLHLVTLSIAHGRPVIDPISRLIEQAGADSIFPPEAHGVGVEVYAQKHRLPAISLGWFSVTDPTGMVRRPIEGFDLHTEFALVTDRAQKTTATKSFLEYAETKDWQVD